MFSEALRNQATEILAAARAKNLRITTAESCTGGLLAGLLTEIAGSSDVFERGFVTYSNEAKEDLLGVPGDLIDKHGAVSNQVALAMANGALRRSLANYSIAVTGVAGPGGGTELKPVGLVYIAVAGRSALVGADAAMWGPATVAECRFGDLGRTQVRLKTIEAALQALAISLRAIP